MMLRIKLSARPLFSPAHFYMLSFMFFLAGCNPTTSVDTPIFRDLDGFFKAEFPENEPGGAILLIRNDSTLFTKGYGLANLETKEPITTQTLFNLGSITKTFVANAILLLHEQGKLSLEDSIFKFFPEFRKKSIAQKVKIKHLLTHTSGLPDIRNISGDSLFFLSAKDQENWDPILQADSLLFEPGSEFEYSNPAYNGLALIIEKVSGMKWQKFVAKNIFDPSHMTTSTITDGAHPDKGVSHAYVNNHSKWVEDDYGEEPTFAAAGNGGVWSSVEELARYEQAIQQAVFLPSKRIEDSRIVKRFDNWKGTRPFDQGWSWFKPEVKNNVTQPIIGWSWFVGKTPKGLKVVGHTGSQGGFLCNYVSIPEKKILIVILCNTPRDLYAYTNKLISYLDI
ncbi:MAG TPA: serine hydrolase domain-containing protein [Chryseolinea sp.]|nr:serine hydrolase domain-containing protein [Chryseolinea sp.]